MKGASRAKVAYCRTSQSGTRPLQKTQIPTEANTPLRRDLEQDSEEGEDMLDAPINEEKPFQDKGVHEERPEKVHVFNGAFQDAEYWYHKAYGAS